MSPKYAKDQPVGFTNRIERVAIVGAGGSVGEYIVKELLKTGKHTVTAITRKDSKSKLPEGVKVAPIDYDDEASLVSALEGQQYFIISLSVNAPPDTQSKLLKAAAKAKVPYVMPNCYGVDTTNEKLANETLVGNGPRQAIAEIEELGVSAWTAMVCSFWYEFSLVTGPEWFGFDFANKKATFYDDGNTKINASTWDQCGRAAAALLSLKELPEDENDKSITLSNWANKPLYISSFLTSQKEMWESWKRVTGAKDEEWTFEYQPSAERYKQGIERMQGGDRRGFAQAMYARVFYPNGDGNYEDKHGLANEVLGLPKEDLDQATAHAKQFLEEGYSYMDRLQ